MLTHVVSSNIGPQERVVEAARLSIKQGLNCGTEGNVSLCDGRLVYITPTAVAYEVLKPEQVSMLTMMDGVLVDGLPASTEAPFHLAIYRRYYATGVRAIAHCHSEEALAFASSKKGRYGIPAFHYMVGVLGGVDIRCAYPFELTGSEELAARVVRALEDRRGCLLANHGQVTVGADLGEALALAHLLERLARQYRKAGGPNGVEIICRDQMEQMLPRLSAYSQNQKKS